MKIICIARNYLTHIQELHHNIDEQPIFFFKPDTALAKGNEPFYLPDFAQCFDYECEVVIRINRVGKCIEKRFAKNYYDSVALGIDFTARDFQQKEIAKGLPWTLSKTFDYSAAVSDFIPLSELGSDVQNLNFNMSLNGNIVQQANTSSMIYPIDGLISYISRFITLKIGDFIFSGTPSGIGTLSVGNILEGSLNNHKLLHIEIK
jgi:2-keto-4-pentenoate hydratase/2-oxohepta-3-ene-1,7-dioic acid hydratase in catechol pathway